MIPQFYFIHPEDEKALSALKAVPGFDLLTKKFMQVGYETYLHGVNMASKVRLSDTQLPERYGQVKKVCEKMEIECPEVYLEMNPYPNA